MMGKSTEKRIAREADKIASLKEELDALSWSRVLELGKSLQKDTDGSAREDVARELVSIAQSNLSLFVRLGIDTAPTQMMASGIEVLDGGLAEAALKGRGEQVQQAKHAATPDSFVPDRVESVFFNLSFEPEDASFAAPAEKIEAAEAVSCEAPEDEAQAIAYEMPGEEPEVFEQMPGEETAPPETPSAADDSCPIAEKPDVKRERVARIRSVYESRDGGLCVFEDDRGHLVAVDASKLA